MTAPTPATVADYVAAWGEVGAGAKTSSTDVVHALFPELDDEAADALGTLLFHFGQWGHRDDVVVAWLNDRHAELVSGVVR